jgi:hypothetical protein
MEKTVVKTERNVLWSLANTHPGWDCPQAQHMSTSFKTGNMIRSF